MGELRTGGLWSNGNGVGKLTSVPQTSPSSSSIGIPYINATTIHMDDFNYRRSGDSDAPYVLNAQGLLATDDGHYLGVKGSGLLANTAHVRAIMANETGVEPTRWGELDSFTTWTFQAAADGPYAALAEATFVANIRISPSDDADTVSHIDYRLSKVLPGPLCGGGGSEEDEVVGEL